MAALASAVCRVGYAYRPAWAPFGYPAACGRQISQAACGHQASQAGFAHPDSQAGFAHPASRAGFAPGSSA